MSIQIHSTIGPASLSDSSIRQLLLAGTDVFRVNLSHCRIEDCALLVERVRKIGLQTRKPVQIAPDIRGRKLRLGSFKFTDQIMLAAGQDYILHDTIEGQEILGDATSAWVNHPALSSKLKPGAVILLDDGALRLSVEAIQPHEVLCRVEIGGLLPARSGVNIPGLPTDLPPIRKKDLDDLDALCTLDIDMVYLSYVETASDIAILRQALRERNCLLPIIAKIERRVALNNLEEIIGLADAICLARGDLGVEVPLCDIPFLQHHVTARTHAAGKPFILAGEVLHSLVSRHVPARAELTDVAMALFQKVDGFILSDETAVGVAPPGAVRTLVSLIDGMSQHLTNKNAAQYVNTLCDHFA